MKMKPMENTTKNPSINQSVNQRANQWINQCAFGAIVALLILGWGFNSAHAAKNKSKPQKREPGVWVSKSDGALQCDPESGIALAKGAAELSRMGVKVLLSRKASDGNMHGQACGMSSGSLNSYSISKKDFDRYQAKLQAAGFQVQE